MHRILATAVLLTLILAACSATVPEFEDGATLEWDQALVVLNSGDVDMVFQTHDLDVTLTMNDGRQLHTVEPSIDAIFAEIDACGAPCADIVLVTE